MPDDDGSPDMIPADESPASAGAPPKCPVADGDAIKVVAAETEEEAVVEVEVVVVDGGPRGESRRIGFRALDMYWGLLVHVVLSAAIVVLVVWRNLFTRGDLQMFFLSLPLTAFFLWLVWRRVDGMREAGLSQCPGRRGWGDVVGMWLLFRPVMWVAIILNRVLENGVDSLAEYLGLDFFFYGVATPFMAAAADLLTSITLSYHGHSGLTVVLLFASLVVLAPVGEELWFRGVGLAGYRKTGSDFRAVFWTSIVFGLVHGIKGFFPAAALGALFAVIRIRTGSLYPSIVLHAVNNFFALSVAVLPILRQGGLFK